MCNSTTIDPVIYIKMRSVVQDRACIKHGIDYVYFKDLTRRTASDKTLRDKAFHIAKNKRNERCQ